ncbi:MAG: phosphoribosylglycinamide formyltransferase [Pyrinomonadaceae bacterium]|nr:phosphoribosylglycinamide formyltransferase [Pyrinomonadaceae bacterium]MCX7640337.1 phosphoribosylglycinamide formyltransferase [Pyrinomonadaceae bacterium]MDW8304764.1 phosphoribosylglycinamide formyltransferase [Acidobacteriota bacterium]
MRLGILISGRGSNMAAIIEAVRSGKIPKSEVSIVISNNPQAKGLEKARAYGIETLVISHKGIKREEHEERIITELRKRKVDFVCLAGYMRLLSEGFIKAFPNRIVNIHPSLLPAFPGLNAQKQALEYGVKITGCTVHFVDEQLDHGPIILQRSVEVKEDDTEQTLSERILQQEHSAYVEALKLIADDRIRICGRRVILKN